MRALKASVRKNPKLARTENDYARYDHLTQLIQQWAKNQGFEIFSQEGYHSKTVVTVTIIFILMSKNLLMISSIVVIKL